ncbi:MAG: TldD/PmbA family protein [Clostridia bacterium]|nr:TldD/PmbA family protein [Clostridia bacterium]
MVMENFVTELFKTALEKGCEACEAYYVDGDSFEAGVLDGELDTYSVSCASALSLRVKYNGRDGYACTECICPASELVERAMDNALCVENEDVRPMQTACEYVSVPENESKLFDMSEKERIQLAFDMEKRVNTGGARVMMCNVAVSEQSVHIRNTLGLCADSIEKEALVYVNAAVSEGAEARDGFAFKRGIEAHDINSCADEAVSEAKAFLGAEPVESGEYKVIFKNDAAASLLESFFGMFSADAAQKGLSLLASKKGEKIGSELITIIDDPFHEYSPRSFDAEGVPSVRTEVIESGVLKTLLYDLKTAYKDGVKSTSNAGRASVFSPTAIMPTNFYIKQGEKSLEMLLKEMGDGILITEVSGTHAGVNTVSGEFSLLAKGHLIKNGEKCKPIDRITVSGTFLQLLKSVEAIGDDLKFTIPQGGNVGSPSLLAEKIAIAGK